MIKKKSKRSRLGFQLLKWVLFVPSLLALFIYSIGVLIELFAITAKTTEHTSKDVKNARMWFVYTAFPFFGQGYYSSIWTGNTNAELKRMVEVYGKRPFWKWGKLYFPFAEKYTALEAHNLKTGNSFEFVD